MKEYFFENRIYYRKNDFTGERLTLVFAHGVSGSSSAWFPYEKIFENKYNILNYDIRGHGMSKKYPNYSDYEIKKFVSDLHDLISYLNISRFILIRNSFAGLMHIEYLKLYPETIRFQCEEVSVVITHIGGYPKRYKPGIKKYLQTLPTDLFICGHSHILKVMYDQDLKLLHMNPGAAGKEGFHQIRTLLRFSVTEKRIHDLEVIEMKRW